MEVRVVVRGVRRRVDLPLPALALSAAIALASTTPAAAPPGAAPKEAATAVAPLAPSDSARLDAEARAPATDVRIAPSSRGVLGAWLVVGPFRAAPHAAFDAGPAGVSGIDESHLAPSSGDVLGGERDFGVPRKKPPARWMIASSNDGSIDLKGALEASGTDLVAYAAGTIHVERAGRHLLLLGVDDGVRVSIDGRAVYTRDDPRPVREDDDIITLDLTAGDHDVLLKLHQRDGAWAFRARLVDATLGVPIGSYLRLPGTTADDARTLAGKMSLVSIDRTFDPASEPPRYRPRITVRFPEGAPRGVPIPVTTRLAKGDETIFDVNAGGVPVTSSGAGELVIALPAIAPQNANLSLDVVAGGRTIKSTFPARTATEQALVRATRALAATPADAAWLPASSRTTAEYLTKRLAGLLAKGDVDVEAQNDEARDVDRLAAALEQKNDPYATATGAMRRAIKSPIDGEPTEFGLYVPPWYKSTRKFPLVVALHGLNGYALGMMRWLFGGDDPKRDQSWEDRHVGALPPADAIIVTPQAYGNTLYRELGEVDVMNVVSWAMKTYNIDETRVTITGPSMGGIGSASIPLHFPHVFAAAMPLCGYHSYLIRHDVAGRPQRPWERFLAEERSNVLWAENGEHLPLFIVHGTEDKPEENSGVLIDRYEKLGFAIKHEHPDAGHNVWQQTYEDLAGLKWLMRRAMNPHPGHVRFKTTRTRWSKSAWVTVDELAKESGWADVDARVRGKTKITLTSSNIGALTLARDASLLDTSAATTVVADGQSLSFDTGETIALHRDAAGAWQKGPAEHTGLAKRGTITGPIRDVFYEPITFVYATGGDDARANEEVARSFSRIRGGVSVSYPIMTDVEFLAKNEPLANDRALFLVGRTNKVLAALEQIAPMPIRVEAGSVTVGSERFTGRELGAAFIRPNPARPDRYVVVVAGSDVPGTLRALSLPDLLPDFAVWDESIAPSRGQILLGAGSLRAGGLFKNDWSLPLVISDPLAKAPRAPVTAPKDEQD
jgi:poly(3-hydroxybutyrate) depolymerase